MFFGNVMSGPLLPGFTTRHADCFRAHGANMQHFHQQLSVLPARSVTKKAASPITAPLPMLYVGKSRIVYNDLCHGLDRYLHWRSHFHQTDRSELFDCLWLRQLMVVPCQDFVR